MFAMVVGDSGLCGVLRADLGSSGLASSRWSVPRGASGVDAVRVLESFPAPSGGGVVFASVPGSYVGVVAQGWRVFWCGVGVMPVGCRPLPDRWLGLSVSSLVFEQWGVRVVDRRLVVDVVAGRLRDVGVVVFVASATGGVGKSVSARRLCEAASARGVSALLVDGNRSQDSQRSFFDPAHRLVLHGVGDWHAGGDVRLGATPGRLLGVSYDVAFAPAPDVNVSWADYQAFIAEARRRWGLIVVDLDRFGVSDSVDVSSAAGGLLMPSLLRGDCLLFIVRAGVATQRDAANVLGVFKASGVESSLVAVKECVPEGLERWPKLDYGRFGVFLGSERWDSDAGGRIARGESGWLDPGLDSVRASVLDWLFPGRGFKPAPEGKPAQQGKVRRGLLGGLFHGRK